MKRGILLCLILFMVVSFIGAAVHPAHADANSQQPSACAAITAEHPRSADCTAEIMANPAPDLERPVAPAGRSYGLSTPRSVLFPSTPLPYEIAWMLKDWYFSDAPGVLPQHWSNERIIKKASLHYVYAAVKIKGHEWDLIGPDQWMDGEYVAVLHIPKRPATVTGRWITLDLSEQTLVAMQDDTPVFATLISAAWNGYGVTREGLFHIYARTRFTIFRGPPWKKIPDYILNHVPDVMFFDHHIALHGAYWHDWFGFPRTHGCVNIPVGDEAWLWNWVSEALNYPNENKFFLDDPSKAPFVYVYKSGKLTTPATNG